MTARLLSAAFPRTKGACMPQDGGQDYRKWQRDKANRARGVNCPSTFGPKMVANLWGGSPMHWAWQRL
eukprot:45469-Pyramimonas_sp.AAC.1